MQHREYSKLPKFVRQDCNIYLQEGVTRARRELRSRLASTLASLPRLTRLDLANNYLIGCLGEILAAVPGYLTYLSIRGCDVNESDLTSLTESKHTDSLRELNLSKVCHFSIYEIDRVLPSSLVKVIQHFSKLTVLNLSQNHLTESSTTDLSNILPSITNLRGLDISGNIILGDNIVTLAQSCAQIPAMQLMRVTCLEGGINDGDMLPGNAGLREVEERLAEVLRSLGREDIVVNFSRLSFAILVDLVDFFD